MSRRTPSSPAIPRGSCATWSERERPCRRPVRSTYRRYTLQERQRPRSPLEHCTCPGPLWPLLIASRFGCRLRLSSAQRRLKHGLRPGEVAYCNPPEPGVPAPASGTWGILPADAWNHYIGEAWERIVS